MRRCFFSSYLLKKTRNITPFIAPSTFVNCPFGWVKILYWLLVADFCTLWRALGSCYHLRLALSSARVVNFLANKPPINLPTRFMSSLSMSIWPNLSSAVIFASKVCPIFPFDLLFIFTLPSGLWKIWGDLALGLLNYFFLNFFSLPFPSHACLPLHHAALRCSPIEDCFYRSSLSRPFFQCLACIVVVQ